MRTSSSRVPLALVAGALAVLAPLAFALLAGARPYEVIVKAFPGAGVAGFATVLAAVGEVAAVLTVGALVWVLFLRDLPPKRAKKLQSGPDLHMLRLAANTFAVVAGLQVVVDTLDNAGIGMEQLGQPGLVAYALNAADPTIPLVRFGFALLVAVTALFATRWTTMLVALWASAFAVLAPIVTGQVLVGPSHDLGLDAAVLQTVVGYPLLGVLAVGALLPSDAVGDVAWRRIGRIAVVAVPTMLLTDLVLAWFKLAGTPILGSVTGWLIVTRWAVLTGLVAALFLVRRRSPTAFVVGILSAGAWLAATVTMTREPPPQFFVPTSVAEIFMGFETLAPPTALVLLTHWRVNLLLLALAVAAVVAYLLAVHTLRRRGDRWPLGRTIAWCLGWAFVVVATSSGIGKYSAPHFGIHMLMHMTLSMVVPVLLALGGAVTLFLRASTPNSEVAGPHEWLTWVMGWRVTEILYNPLVAFVAFISSYYGLYLSGLFGELMRYHWGHQLMNLHFIIVGYLYYSLIIGVDRGPKPLPHIAKLGMAMAAMPFHAFFGVILMNSNLVIAADFYRYLDMPWADLTAAQELGGGVAWAGGEIPALIVVIALGIQWARQDSREARRQDRHFDSGRDAEFDDYNAMLARLSERSGSENK